MSYLINDTDGIVVLDLALTIRVNMQEICPPAVQLTILIWRHFHIG